MKLWGKGIFKIFALVAMLCIVGSSFATSTSLSEISKKPVKVEKLNAKLTKLETQILISKVKVYLKTHPNASADEVYNYLLKEKLTRIKISKNKPLLLWYPKLNEQEKKLFNEDPYKGSIALACAVESFAQQYYYYGVIKSVGTNADAFRHSLWMSLIASNINKEYALRWGYAHEGYESRPPNTDLQNNIDLRMDIYNDEIGVNYAPSEVMNHIVRGDFWRYIKEDGTIYNYLIPTDGTGRIR